MFGPITPTLQMAYRFSLVCNLTFLGSTGGFLLLRDFSGFVYKHSVSECHNTLFLSSPHL